MEKINLDAYPWIAAADIFQFFKKETDCLDEKGNLLIQPKYVVAIDDDMVSAYHAAIIMRKAVQQFGQRPTLLCCGREGLLTKYLNSIPGSVSMTDGERLKNVCTKLLGPLTDVVVLDKGENTGETLKSIIDYLNGDLSPIVFCPTARRSMRLERAVEFSLCQYPGTYPLNAYWFVPDETLEDCLQLYNGRGCANGLPLLSEAASLFNRIGTDKYTNLYVAEYEGNIPKYIKISGFNLASDYPLRIFRRPSVNLRQFLKIYFSILWNRKAIADDLNEKIELWKASLTA